MEATVVHRRVMKSNKHEHFCLQTSTLQLVDTTYDVHISKNPCCSCLDFVQLIAQVHSYVACKHIYYVLLRIFVMDVNHNLFIHQAKLADEDFVIFQNRPRTL